MASKSHEQLVKILNKQNERLDAAGGPMSGTWIHNMLHNEPDTVDFEEVRRLALEVLNSRLNNKLYGG